MVTSNKGFSSIWPHPRPCTKGMREENARNLSQQSSIHPTVTPPSTDLSTEETYLGVVWLNEIFRIFHFVSFLCLSNQHEGKQREVKFDLINKYASSEFGQIARF